MELLLNLAWLLLALPAYWLWREGKGVNAKRRFGSLQCLFALVCLLVILFPVISATDDLHVMRAEMEESSGGKRSLSQKSGDRPCSCKWHGQPALIIASGFAVIFDPDRLALPIASWDIPPVRAIEPSGRAPPHSFLG